MYNHFIAIEFDEFANVHQFGFKKITLNWSVYICIKNTVDYYSKQKTVFCMPCCKCME